MKAIVDSYNNKENDMLYSYLHHPDDPVIASYKTKGMDLTNNIILQWEDAYKYVCKIAKHHGECMIRYTASDTNSNKFENFVGNSESTYYYHVIMRDYEALFDAFKLVLDKQQETSLPNRSLLLCSS